MSNNTMPYAIALHGGALRPRLELKDTAAEHAMLQTLTQILTPAVEALRGGVSAIELVVQTVLRLEEDPLFNAGRGSCLTCEGTHELDAALMCGQTKQVGALCGLRTTRNPILAAAQVLAERDLVFLGGAGGDAFARQAGLEQVDNDWFTTDLQRKLLESVQNKAHSDSTSAPDHIPSKLGTVGCVVLDTAGNLAAGTSTGGVINKPIGRIGDSPLIGCGTYADNRSCAISATGRGEGFIRATVAKDIAARLEYGNQDVQTACNAVILDELPQSGGRGGVIAVDRLGNIAMPFNTEGMYRASASHRQSPQAAIY